MKLALIPPGEFLMGSPKELIEEELKAHDDDRVVQGACAGRGAAAPVRITRPFYLGVYLVTQQEYQQVMGKNPSEFSATGKNKDKVAGQDTKRFPVECVSWDDAVEFCRKLSEHAGGAGGGANVPTAVGGAVGVCLPCGEHGPVQLQFGQSDTQGVRREGACRLRLVQQQFGR